MFRANNLIIVGTLLSIGHRINPNVIWQVCLKSFHKCGPFLNENCLRGNFYFLFFKLSLSFFSSELDFCLPSLRASLDLQRPVLHRVSLDMKGGK